MITKVFSSSIKFGKHRFSPPKHFRGFCKLLCILLIFKRGITYMVPNIFGYGTFFSRSLSWDYLKDIYRVSYVLLWKCISLVLKLNRRNFYELRLTDLLWCNRSLPPTFFCVWEGEIPVSGLFSQWLFVFKFW